MRVRMHFAYKSYPLAPELEAKSAQVGTFTHPIFGVAISGALLVASGFMGLPIPVSMVLMVASLVLVPALLVKYRKKKFAEYDALYAKILQEKGRAQG